METGKKNRLVLRVRSVAAMLLVLAGAALGGTCVIIEGTDPPPDSASGDLHDIGSTAASNYTAKGYTINRLPNTPTPNTKQGIKDAINAAGVNAIFYIGHGTEDAGGNFTPGMAFGDGDGDVLTPDDLTGDYSGIKHVELQACGQNLQGWKDKFPNASLDAWSNSVTVDAAANDCKNNSPDRIPEKPSGVSGVSNVYTTDARLDYAIKHTFENTSHPGRAIMITDWMQFHFQVRPSLVPSFASRQFNVRIFDEAHGYLPLRGLTIVNGNLVNNLWGGYPTAQFTMTIESHAFTAAMQNLDLVQSMFAGGQITIDNNISGLPASVAFQGAADAYFGLYTLPPKCIGDINGDGHTNTLDLGTMLAHFGQQVIPNTSGDLNGDGVVNTLDLGIELAHFGC